MFCLPVPTLIYLWEIYIQYFQDRSACSAAGKHVDRSWEYINRSHSHECGSWDWGRAIPRKGIHKLGFSLQCSLCIRFRQAPSYNVSQVRRNYKWTQTNVETGWSWTIFSRYPFSFPLLHFGLQSCILSWENCHAFRHERAAMHSVMRELSCIPSCENCTDGTWLEACRECQG